MITSNPSDTNSSTTKSGVMFPILPVALTLLFLGGFLLAASDGRLHTASAASIQPDHSFVSCVPGACFAPAGGGTIISATSLLADSQCDDCSVPITFPWPVQIGSRTYITASAVSNGHLDFDEPDTTNFNGCLPLDTINTAIFAHWADLDMRTQFCGPECGVYTATNGTAPNRTFSIEWVASLYTNTVQPVNFEIRFYETPRTQFDIVYGIVTDGGISATVGLQFDGYFCQFECNTGGLNKGLVLTYPPIPFTDVRPTDYFHNAVQYLYCLGVISGYSDNTFQPYNNASRGQMCKIVVLGFSLPIDTTGGPHFSDVLINNVFYPYVETAYNRGIVNGYGTLFRPNNNVTRGQLCKIVVNAAGWAQRYPPIATFTDVLVGSTFYPFVETAYCHGIISGYGTEFRPNNPATRGQISKIVYEALVGGRECP